MYIEYLCITIYLSAVKIKCNIRLAKVNFIGAILLVHMFEMVIQISILKFHALNRYALYAV